MFDRLLFLSLLAAVAVGVSDRAKADEAASLRLVPFPKEVTIRPGQFALDRPLAVEAAESVPAAVVEGLVEELERAGAGAVEVRPVAGSGSTLRLVAGDREPAQPSVFPEDAPRERYQLTVEPEAVMISGRAAAGAIHGVATLRQLIRANRRDGGIPSVRIDDWPSIQWRAFQDDLTRGPSTKLSCLEADVARGAFLKLNVFTYYMQHQFAFTKHPDIGPKDGSLTPEELSALVEHARGLGVDILGNQQSFAHMQHLLALDAYKDLAEDPRTLSPVNEKTYQLLDDLYGDVLPRLPFEFFNVCCDETWGLGTSGPSKPLADQIGPGGVYVRHIRRVHDLVHGKYGKRMMMWGDIILRHPDRLDQIPDDVVMLTWGYGPRESFDDQIVPFARSGFAFFVCPGVNNWNRVLPDFRQAAVNIQNFVRDGAKHGAIGVLNTSWDDDGENLNAPNWWGFAWGAECAWNASKTPLDEFNARIGAVLFGDRDERFGRAIELLSDPRVCGLTNREFWTDDSQPVRLTADDEAEERLDIVRRALALLEACRRDAVVDAELLDPLIFGAKRIELFYQRQINRVEAAAAYDEAGNLAGEEAAGKIEAAAAALRRSRDALQTLRPRWRELWLRENKPYALDWSLDRYDRALAVYDERIEQLQAASEAVRQHDPLPPAADVGLAVWSRPERLARPAQIESSLGSYQDYYKEFAFDGNSDTFYWSNRGLVAGDHFTVVLDEPAKLKSVTVLMGTSRYRQEYVRDGRLEISVDGEVFRDVGRLDASEVRAAIPSVPIRAVRLTVDKPQKYWLIVREMIIE